MAIVAVAMTTLKESDMVNCKRYEDLATQFQNRFGQSPKFICRAPGRVNLIGEHVDYCGYSVLPMAVNQDISFAVSPNEDGALRFSNVDENFKDYESTVKSYTIDSTKPQWFHYILCGLRGVAEHAALENLCGMNILVHGTVPKAAGMSSSSAMVCAAGLATAYINNCQISRHDLADVCAKCERYIGTQGGGMDQSICFLAEKGTAKFISFNPLKAEDVIFPDGAVFVITNSCVKMEKATTSLFNIRVAECKIATKILAKKRSVDASKVTKLMDVQRALNASFDDMLVLVDSTLHKEVYTREEICKELEMNDEQLKESLLSRNTQDVQEFKLYQRARHIFSEAQRAHLFKAACDDQSDDPLRVLGSLMDASHKSLSELYECSCPELDTLTQLCRDSGAFGSLLTGAGWGGCAVSLVSSDTVDSFLAAVRKGYYQGFDESALTDAIFAAEPGDGAQVYTL